MHSAYEALLVSVGITIVALLIFGFFKAKAIGQPPVAGSIKTALIGALAAGAAFGLAQLIEMK